MHALQFSGAQCAHTNNCENITTPNCFGIHRNEMFMLSSLVNSVALHNKNRFSCGDCWPSITHWVQAVVGIQWLHFLCVNCWFTKCIIPRVLSQGPFQVTSSWRVFKLTHLTVCCKIVDLKNSILCSLLFYNVHLTGKKGNIEEQLNEPFVFTKPWIGLEDRTGQC